MTFHEEENLGKAYDGALMRRFLRYLRPYTSLVVLSAMLVFARIGMDLIGPLLLRAIVDGPITRKDVSALPLWILLFVASIAGIALFEIAEVWVTNLAGQRVIRDIRVQLFSHLQRLPMAFYDHTPVGRLVVRITNDVENLNELFTSGLVAFFSDIFLILGVLIMMLVISWEMTLVSLATAPLVLAVVFIFRALARTAYRDMRTRIARLNAWLNESILGMRTIQMFTREETCAGKFDTLNNQFRRAANRTIRVYSFFFPGVETLSSLSVALLVWWGGRSILEHSLSFGSFMAFWYCAQKFFQPLRDLSEKYNILQAAMASSERLFKLLDEPPAAGGQPVAALKGEIEFDHVSFSYDGKTPVLRDISFHLSAGERTAIVGLTGAGKTTITNLLLRLYEPTLGRVLIDGRDIRTMDPPSLRRTMGLVLQDVFLFRGTIEENIRLGDPTRSPDQIATALRAAHADRLVARLPKGLATDVRERGVALSGGERQLLSIARALACDPRILILDEATSSVDSESEALVQEALHRLLEGRTCLVIAHRLSTLRYVHRVLVLHGGTIVEQGSHEELLQRDGLYASFHRLQFEHVPA